MLGTLPFASICICFQNISELHIVLDLFFNQVAPAELENLLLTHESVADSGVVGIPDFEAGELPYAWVVLKPGLLQGTSLTEQELQDWVAGKTWINETEDGTGEVKE